MATLGQKLEASESLDSALSVSAGSSANGATRDIGANTSPQSVSEEAQFTISQTGTTDAADIEVKVQHSWDGTNWPDSDQGEPVFSWVAGSAGADLTRSAIVRFTPKARYYRFVPTNNNGTDAVDFSSTVATTLAQSGS